MPRKNTPHAPAQITPAGGIKKEVDPVSGTETAPEPKPTRGTVGALVKELLMDANLTYAEIVARVIAGTRRQTQVHGQWPRRRPAFARVAPKFRSATLAQSHNPPPYYLIGRRFGAHFHLSKPSKSLNSHWNFYKCPSQAIQFIALAA